MILRGGQIGYRFSCNEPFWLVADELRAGWPLSVVFFTAQNAIASVMAFDGKGKLVLAEPSLVVCRLEEAWNAGSVGSSLTKGRGILVIGHPNFAHHLWNELAGLDAWLKTARPENICALSIVPMYEPIGPLERLFPSLVTAKMIREKMDFVRTSSKTLATRIGSTQISESVRQVVTTYAEDACDMSVVSKIRGAYDGAGPIFWVTVRLDGRTCDNQREFLVELLSRIESEYPQSHVILDGFSFPSDFGNPSFDGLRRAFEERATETNNFINGVLNDLHRRRCYRATNASCLSLINSIALAANADYYVAHAGTIQHKIAWVHNTPGYIHTCSAGLTESARRWYADQVERGTIPSIAPKDLISDTSPSSAHVRASRNSNYMIKSVGDLVSDILCRARLR